MNIICHSNGAIAFSDGVSEYTVHRTKVANDLWYCTLEGYFTIDGMSIIGDGVDELEALTALLEWADEAEQDWLNAPRRA